MTTRLLTFNEAAPTDVRWTDAVPAPPPAPHNTPDLRVVLVSDRAEALACASLWCGDGPRLDGLPTGRIGHLAAADAARGADLLRRCADLLTARGFHRVFAPIDGSTWHAYRAVTDRGDEPPFFLEPNTPPFWPAMLAGAGFAPVASYISALEDDLSPEAGAPPVLPPGTTIATLQNHTFDDALRTLHTLSVAGFTENYLYTPLSWPGFQALYEPLRPLWRPEHVHIATHNDEPVGFLFTIPDMAETRRTGKPPVTIIFKSLAVLPAHQGRGLGAALIAAARRSAHTAGFRRAVFALMIEGSRSARIGARSARTFRRYALFGRTLHP